MKKHVGIVLAVAYLVVCFVGGLMYYIEENGNSFAKVAEDTYLEVAESQTALQEQADEDTYTDTEQEETAATQVAPTAEEIGLREQLTVEAGTQQLDVADFFFDFDGQEASCDREFDEEMLSSVGEVYPVVLTYEGYEYPCTVEIVDTTAPEFVNYSNISIVEGDSIAYKKHVEVTDNSGEEVELSVDSSAVVPTKAGQYEVVYTASDAYGNVSQLTLQVTVKEKFVCTEETVGPLADAVIATVVTDGMTQWDKAYALFVWCQSNVSYTSASGDMSSVWSGAYEGINNRRGDCYTFAATYYVLLTRAGVENVIVTRVGGTSPHYWNLVCTEVGWYHCDTSPRNKNFPYTCFMQTDEQVAAYTAYNTDKPNYYTFDTTAYPERGTQIVYQ